jgi:uncharacterized protein (TIGR02246 family)
MTHEADRFALADVMTRYAAAVDDRDLDAYAALFADDVEVIGFAEHTIHGRSAWVEFVVGALQRFGATQHLLGPQLVEVERERARVRTDVQATHVLETSGDLFVLWATYRTELARTGSGWEIKRHELVSRASHTLVRSGTM